MKDSGVLVITVHREPVLNTSQIPWTASANYTSAKLQAEARATVDGFPEDFKRFMAIVCSGCFEWSLNQAAVFRKQV